MCPLCVRTSQFDPLRRSERVYSDELQFDRMRRDSLYVYLSLIWLTLVVGTMTCHLRQGSRRPSTEMVAANVASRSGSYRHRVCTAAGINPILAIIMPIMLGSHDRPRRSSHAQRRHVCSVVQDPTGPRHRHRPCHRRENLRSRRRHDLQWHLRGRWRSLHCDHSDEKACRGAHG